MQRHLYFLYPSKESMCITVKLRQFNHVKCILLSSLIFFIKLKITLKIFVLVLDRIWVCFSIDLVVVTQVSK